MSPSRQVRPKVSLTTTATSTPSSSASRARSPRAEASASSGSRTSEPWSTLDASMPAAATTQPCGVCTIFSGPRRATTRTVWSSIGLPGGLAVGAGLHPDQGALDLGDDLGGHDDDVAVGQPGRRARDRAGEVVAGRELRQPRDGERPRGPPAA